MIVYELTIWQGEDEGLGGYEQFSRVETRLFRNAADGYRAAAEHYASTGGGGSLTWERAVTPVMGYGFQYSVLPKDVE